MSAAADLSWSLTWEDDLAEHDALGVLLARCFPRSGALARGDRSWVSARPELRLVGFDGVRPVAHLAILRRFLRAGRASVLVGDVGLVAVEPELRGRGLGAELLARTDLALRELDLPFGFLTCGEQVVAFYATGGWVRVACPTRMIRADGRVQVYGGASMVLPVHARLEAWPGGETVDRNGYEL